MIIAIDGSAASGKGTLAKSLARQLGYDYLDTGALYRAVGLSLIEAGVSPDNIVEKQSIDIAKSLDLDLTKSPLIRDERVADMASRVAAITPVRTVLLDLQRRCCDSTIWPRCYFGRSRYRYGSVAICGIKTLY